jgi:hypothetical protein
LQIRIITKKPDDPNNVIYLKSVEWFLDNLLHGNSIPKNIKRIDIRLDNIVRDAGHCFIKDLKNKSMVVTISVKKHMDFFEIITTLAHECVHASQFILGKLSYNEKDEWVWKKKNYGISPYQGLTNDTVMKKLPWEKEAYNSERDLVTKFILYYIDSNS